MKSLLSKGHWHGIWIKGKVWQTSTKTWGWVGSRTEFPFGRWAAAAH